MRSSFSLEVSCCLITLTCEALSLFRNLLLQLVPARLELRDRKNAKSRGLGLQRFEF